MKSNKENIILETTRLILIILFSYSSIIKLFNVTKFMRTLLVSHFPEEIANIIAFAVVFSEIIIVLLLIINYTKLIGLYSSLISFLIFTCYIIYMKIWLPKLPCSCGGLIQKLTWNQHLIMNVVFSVLIYFVLKMNKRAATPNIYSNNQVTS